MPNKISYRKEICLPTGDYANLPFLDDQQYDALMGEFYHGAGINKIFGHADRCQNPMELECEMVTNGIYYGDSSGYNDPRRPALEKNIGNWRLLLQVDSNDEANMMWGDVGRLYYWIRQDDLKNRQFDKSWFIIQGS